MVGKYVLLALILVCSQETLAHILPYAHDDFAMHDCVEKLARSAVYLCSIYGEYKSDDNNGVPIIPRDVVSDRWSTRVSVLRSCCLKPCTFSELIAIC